MYYDIYITMYYLYYSESKSRCNSKICVSMFNTSFFAENAASSARKSVSTNISRRANAVDSSFFNSLLNFTVAMLGSFY